MEKSLNDWLHGDPQAVENVMSRQKTVQNSQNSLMEEIKLR